MFKHEPNCVSYCYISLGCFFLFVFPLLHRPFPRATLATVTFVRRVASPALLVSRTPPKTEPSATPMQRTPLQARALAALGARLIQRRLARLDVATP